MASLDFQTSEDHLHSKYDNIKLPFVPDTVVKVELRDFRNVSVGYSDWVDTPDPQFHVSCPVVKRKNLRHFKTQTIPKDTTSGKVNETFKFVIPKDHPPQASIPIKIKLYDKDSVCDDFIGEVEIEAKDLPDDGTVQRKTVIFGKKNGELDVLMSKETKATPDIRYSLSLCPEERAFRKKRIPIVCEAMKKLLGDKGPKNTLETPIVSLVASGGGYRAMVGMCGAMKALKDHDLLDIFTYACGLSGSSWYLACAYTLQGMKASEQNEFHEKIRQRISSNFLWDMISITTHREYQVNEMVAAIRKYHLPHSFVNFFPGFMVGKNILRDQMSTKLSQLTQYVEKADVPYPLLVALHVKNREKASQYHAYMERSPYEISIPSYGINVKTSDEGSVWYAGHQVRKCEELPVLFTIGMTGCAFSILLNSFLADGGEVCKNYAKFVESKRIEGKKRANEPLDTSDRVANIESEDEEDYDHDDSELNLLHPEKSEAEEIEIPPDQDKNDICFIRKLIRCLVTMQWDLSCGSPILLLKVFIKREISLDNWKTPFFSSRNAIIGRTARLFNFALGFDSVTRYFLNPFVDEAPKTGDAAAIIKACGMDKPKDKISTTKNIISVVDAGVLKNVPTDVVLRPQRAVDLMIVMDFNAYESDDHFNYEPLLQAAAHAWQSGLKFPPVDFEKITNSPPAEFLVFPSVEPECPTVLWFTLSNCKFKNRKDYEQKSTAQAPESETRKFNNFQVFGEGTAYSTFNFEYDNYHFDQLTELMYDNVSSHIQDIEEALRKVVAKKRKRNARE